MYYFNISSLHAVMQLHKIINCGIRNNTLFLWIIIIQYFVTMSDLLENVGFVEDEVDEEDDADQRNVDEDDIREPPPSAIATMPVDMDNSTLAWWRRQKHCATQTEAELKAKRARLGYSLTEDYEKYDQWMVARSDDAETCLPSAYIETDADREAGAYIIPVENMNEYLSVKITRPVESYARALEYTATIEYENETKQQAKKLRVLSDHYEKMSKSFKYGDQMDMDATLRSFYITKKLPTLKEGEEEEKEEGEKSEKESESEKSDDEEKTSSGIKNAVAYIQDRYEETGNGENRRTVKNGFVLYDGKFNVVATTTSSSGYKMLFAIAKKLARIFVNKKIISVFAALTEYIFNRDALQYEEETTTDAKVEALLARNPRIDTVDKLDATGIRLYTEETEEMMILTAQIPKTLKSLHAANVKSALSKSKRANYTSYRVTRRSIVSAAQARAEYVKFRARLLRNLKKPKGYSARKMIAGKNTTVYQTIPGLKSVSFRIESKDYETEEVVVIQRVAVISEGVRTLNYLDRTYDMNDGIYYLDTFIEPGDNSNPVAYANAEVKAIAESASEPKVLTLPSPSSSVKETEKREVVKVKGDEDRPVKVKKTSATPAVITAQSSIEDFAFFSTPVEVAKKISDEEKRRIEEIIRPSVPFVLQYLFYPLLSQFCKMIYGGHGVNSPALVELRQRLSLSTGVATTALVTFLNEFYTLFHNGPPSVHALFLEPKLVSIAAGKPYASEDFVYAAIDSTGVYYKSANAVRKTSFNPNIVKTVAGLQTELAIPVPVDYLESGISDANSPVELRDVERAAKSAALGLIPNAAVRAVAMFGKTIFVAMEEPTTRELKFAVSPWPVVDEAPIPQSSAIYETGITLTSPFVRVSITPAYIIVALEKSLYYYELFDLFLNPNLSKSQPRAPKKLMAVPEPQPAPKQPPPPPQSSSVAVAPQGFVRGEVDRIDRMNVDAPPSPVAVAPSLPAASASPAVKSDKFVHFSLSEKFLVCAERDYPFTLTVFDGPKKRQRVSSDTRFSSVEKGTRLKLLAVSHYGSFIAVVFVHQTKNQYWFGFSRSVEKVNFYKSSIQVAAGDDRNRVLLSIGPHFLSVCVGNGPVYTCDFLEKSMKYVVDEMELDEDDYEAAPRADESRVLTKDSTVVDIWSEQQLQIYINAYPLQELAFKLSLSEFREFVVELGMKLRQKPFISDEDFSDEFNVKLSSLQSGVETLIDKIQENLLDEGGVVYYLKDMVAFDLDSDKKYIITDIRRNGSRLIGIESDGTSNRIFEGKIETESISFKDMQIRESLGFRFLVEKDTGERADLITYAIQEIAKGRFSSADSAIVRDTSVIILPAERREDFQLAFEVTDTDNVNVSSVLIHQKHNAITRQLEFVTVAAFLRKQSPQFGIRLRDIAHVCREEKNIVYYNGSTLWIIDTLGTAPRRVFDNVPPPSVVPKPPVPVPSPPPRSPVRAVAPAAPPPPSPLRIEPAEIQEEDYGVYDESIGEFVANVSDANRFEFIYTYDRILNAAATKDSSVVVALVNGDYETFMKGILFELQRAENENRVLSVIAEYPRNDETEENADLQNAESSDSEEDDVSGSEVESGEDSADESDFDFIEEFGEIPESREIVEYKGIESSALRIFGTVDRAKRSIDTAVDVWLPYISSAGAFGKEEKYDVLTNVYRIVSEWKTLKPNIETYISNTYLKIEPDEVDREGAMRNIEYLFRSFSVTRILGLSADFFIAKYASIQIVPLKKMVDEIAAILKFDMPLEESFTIRVANEKDRAKKTGTPEVVISKAEVAQTILADVKSAYAQITKIVERNYEFLTGVHFRELRNFLSFITQWQGVLIEENDAALPEFKLKIQSLDESKKETSIQRDRLKVQSFSCKIKIHIIEIALKNADADDAIEFEKNKTAVQYEMKLLQLLRKKVDAVDLGYDTQELDEEILKAKKNVRSYNFLNPLPVLQDA